MTGLYLVTGERPYRGHPPGVEFMARLEPNAERRAIGRGDIRLLERVTPSLRSGSWTIPPGWLSQPTDRPTEAPQGASLTERERDVD